MTDAPRHPAPATAKLPARASLEHLRNEAKQRLKAIRTQDSAARLADAQLAVAREYGFPSWRRLKAHVDARNDLGLQLIEAVRTGDAKTMRRILDSHPELVDTTTRLDQRVRPSDTRAMRLIHLAIAESKIDALRLLIERGADLNVRNHDGRLPLHDCFELNHDDYAKILLDAGAEPDVCAAAAYGMHDKLRAILMSDPNQANDLSTGNSPLGWAVYGQQPASASVLFDHGAIVDRPPYDESAWGPAAMVASTAVTPVLLAHGANPNWQDAEGNTAMHRAISSRIVVDPSPVIRILLDAGADPGIKNRAGRTALDEALLRVGNIAETYYPARPVAAKKLEATIEMLRASGPS